MAKHIQLSLSSATGLWAVFYAPGSSLYMTYSVSGSTLLLDYSNSGFPTTATSPYAKQ